MKVLFHIGIALIAFTAVYDLISALASIRFLTRGARRKFSMQALPSRSLFILLPALSEQNNIRDTLDYLLSCPAPLNTTIVVATTAREPKTERQTTAEIVDKYIQENNADSVLRIHYPSADGRMAHQLNYAIHTLISRELMKPSDIVAVYNADSRPHPSTFYTVSEMMNEDPAVLVVQQSALFFKNYPSLKDWIARADAYTQSYWTLVHEVNRIRSLARRGVISKLLGTHCVGHGLFVRLNALQQVGYFPEDTVTEDSFLGFLFNSHGITVYSLPLLEGADSPSNWKAVARQKYVWFFGPLCYPLYLYKFYRSHRELNVSIAKPITFAAHGALRAARWIGKGPLIVALLLYAILEAPAYILGISVLWATYALAPVFLLYGYRSILTEATGFTIDIPRQSAGALLRMCAGALVYPILHSLPPFYSVLALAKKIACETAINKPKTEE